MSISHLLKEFDPKHGVSLALGVALETVRLEAFEHGYQAGWEDAKSAFEQSKDDLSNAALENLRDVSFTYQEALGAVTAGLEPILHEICNQILPELSRNAVSEHVVEVLKDVTTKTDLGKIVLSASPSQAQALETYLTGQIQIPFEVQQVNDLADDQIIFALNAKEFEINLSEARQKIRNGFVDFLHQHKGVAINE